MKALSLTQPWATLVAIGAKQWETRSWSTKFRGPVAIHASMGFPESARELCWQYPFQSALGSVSADRLPRGGIIAVAEISAIVPTDDWEERFGAVEDEREWHFGNYDAGRFAWKLDNVRPVALTPCKGMLGLWTVPPEVEAALNAQLSMP